MQGYNKRLEETAEIIKDGWPIPEIWKFLDRYGLKLNEGIKKIIVTQTEKNINPEEIGVELLNNRLY
jgi:long-subunit acyl-CoA synthetase (AMP-forming)